MARWRGNREKGRRLLRDTTGNAPQAVQMDITDTMDRETVLLDRAEACDRKGLHG